MGFRTGVGVAFTVGKAILPSEIPLIPCAWPSPGNPSVPHNHAKMGRTAIRIRRPSDERSPRRVLQAALTGRSSFSVLAIGMCLPQQKAQGRARANQSRFKTLVNRFSLL